MQEALAATVIEEMDANNISISSNTSAQSSTESPDPAASTHQPRSAEASNTYSHIPHDQEDVTTSNEDQASTRSPAPPADHLLETSTDTANSDSTPTQEDVDTDQYVLAEIYRPGDKRKKCCNEGCKNASVCSWRNTSDHSIHPSCLQCMRYVSCIFLRIEIFISSLTRFCTHFITQC